MPRKTREEAMHTREKLMESALEVMCEKAYANVSMTEIAERIGYSKGAIYWHFLNKNALLVQLVENACVQIESALAVDCSSTDSYESVRAYYKNKMTRQFENEGFKKLERLLLRKQEWPEEVQRQVFSIFRDRARHEREKVAQMLEKSRHKGELQNDAPVHDLATLITAIFHGLFMYGLSDIDDVKFDFTKQTDFIFDAFYMKLKPEDAK
jgi:TetR/AcrR family acrAB operon transcriptional repressor